MYTLYKISIVASVIQRIYTQKKGCVFVSEWVCHIFWLDKWGCCNLWEVQYIYGINEDDLKNEDNHKKKDVFENNDNLKNKMT